MDDTFDLPNEFFADWSNTDSLGLPPSPNSTNYDIPNTNTISEDGKHIPIPNKSPPCFIFLYGPLSLPHVLNRTLSLTHPPELQRAVINGYTQKMFGPFPAIIPSPSKFDIDVVYGMAYWGTEDDLPALSAYMRENYKLKKVMIRTGVEADYILDQEIEGWTFVWSGLIEDLSEGSFDPSLFPED
ncbi:hypothetical protein ABKN59_003826 [Abortiporus biennis]